MHAYIITGGTKSQRRDRIATLTVKHSVSPHDIITIAPDPTSIGIDNMRWITSRLSIHPVASTCHAVIVQDAHTMTREAQNAFLKTLEEPPGDALIILETGQPDALLPTIISRCQIMRTKYDKVSTDVSDTHELSQTLVTVKQLLEAPAGKRLQRIDALAKTREDALMFVERTISALREELVATHRHSTLRSNEVAKLLRAFLTARTQLQGNITPKLTLDAMFL